MGKVGLMKSYFVWLGSKRARKNRVGNKGALLDEAAKASLPVPNGAILLHDFYQSLLDEGIVVQENGRISCPYPQALFDSLYTAVHLPRFDKKIAVRSTFSVEDQASQSLAGRFKSCLNVDANDPLTLADALCQVWSSAENHDTPMRRDVMLLEMVSATTAGVAFSEQAHQDDLINYTDGLADKLVSGLISGTSLVIPQLRGNEAATANLPPFAQRLQRLLRGVRRTFGNSNWDIEWADDGQVCWLVQLRPITRPSQRNEAFTFANLREILPDPPSPFMAGILELGQEKLFSYYRQFDARLPQNRDMVRLFKGRPFFNISLLTDMMRKWGLPTNLITNNLGGSCDVPTGFRMGRFLRHIPVLLRVGWAQLTAVSKTHKAIQTIQTQFTHPFTNFSSLTDTLADFFVQFGHEMLNQTQALSGPLLILRHTNTLTSHSAGQQSIATKALTDLAPLQTAVQQNPAWQTQLKAGNLPKDTSFQQLWQAYLNKHGHRGIYETDIARPRYHEDPSPLLSALQRPPQANRSAPANTVWHYATFPIWWHCRRVIEVREQWRYAVMKQFDLLRQQFLQLADTAVSQGQLPNHDALWLLTPAEVKLLDQGHVFDSATIEAKQQQFDQRKAYDFPDLIHAFDDFDAYLDGVAPVGLNGRLSGISLTRGKINGRAWVLQEPATQLPAHFDPATTILVARSIDAGWIATFSQVAGVVVEIGGDLSHGSIILRELGLPAITNAAHATKQLQTGDHIVLNATQGNVSIKNDTRL